MSSNASLTATELDRTSFPAWRDGILEAEASGAAQPGLPRSYPGYPCWALERVRPRLFASLDRVLFKRRCRNSLAETMPSRRQLSRLLGAAHGITGPHAAGPTPSAGGLQALELYLAVFHPTWLPSGIYHYDRSGNILCQITPMAARGGLETVIPSMQQVRGGALLFVLVGDGARVKAKYGERGERFLLMEAGHLMQSLCLLSESLGLITLPLGGYFEEEMAGRMQLLDTDVVLYTGICGSPPPTGECVR